MSESEALKPKRSLFNRPTGRKVPPQSTSSSENIFERSKQSFDDILAERQRKQQAKGVRERERRTVKEANSYGVGSRKKRRLSDNIEQKPDTAADCQTCDQQQTLAAQGKSIRHGKDPDVNPPLPSTLTPEPSAQPHEPDGIRSTGDSRSKSAVIDLGSDSDNDVAKPVDDGLHRKKQESNNLPGEDDVDEAFPEIAAAARARARELQSQHARQSTVAEAMPLSEDYGSLESTRNMLSAVPIDDPVVKLFITSPIAGTAPLIVKRRLSQPLREVRSAWCARQRFPHPITEVDIFLAWRFRKIFDVTSCKSLGIAVDAAGAVVIPGQRKGFDSGNNGLVDEDDDSGAKIHLEAVTEEIFDMMKKGKLKGKEPTSPTQSRRSASANNNADSAADIEQNAEKQAQVRITLKAKGLEDYKLIVKLTTKLAQIVTVARRVFKASDSQEVFVEFDGDRLEEDAMVQETEIADLDGLDVHIR